MMIEPRKPIFGDLALWPFSGTSAALAGLSPVEHNDDLGIRAVCDCVAADRKVRQLRRARKEVHCFLRGQVDRGPGLGELSFLGDR